ncbi:DNA-helicase [Urbanus proteus nucleopolyhedrovirus]|uniref:DNA-helicase n=1 Tax=Urbanus proteus nucleopolyhedrovirus TaxID=1675866 RepID=A0A1W6AYI6_9ABAC|nr:DNA-helicase [Urbanus proteus nucleopolyhedrovirus]ARJ36578.1 DNA-helicase [Urbanus proteus nucleopolyhedrovirus]
MATEPISIDIVIDQLFATINENNIHNVDVVDQIVLKSNNKLKLINSFKNFKKIIKLLTYTDGVCSHNQQINISAHDLFVKGNYYLLNVKPFVHETVYHYIEDKINFEEFKICNVTSKSPNLVVKSGEYYFWPNINASFFGWRLYIYLLCNKDIIGDYIPLVHNKTIGAVNLICINSMYNLNVELCIINQDKELLFVNGRSSVDDEQFEKLFDIKMMDGSQCECKVKPTLVYSNKNIFYTIRDNINLQSCSTLDRFETIINVDINQLRCFVDERNNVNFNDFLDIEKCQIVNNLTPSSEHVYYIKTIINDCLKKINETMMELMSQHEECNDNILCDYMNKSQYINFDYVIMLIWKTIVQSKDFEYNVTDIKLYLELLCEIMFQNDNEAIAKAKSKCQNYVMLTHTVFTQLCNHYALFSSEDNCVTLGYYFSVHYMVYIHQLALGNADEINAWNLTYDRIINANIANEVLCRGFFRKIQTSGANLVYNGKHYVSIKKEDELYKITEKTSGTIMSSVKFNDWKYLYYTEEGVYNLIINDYHSNSPFLMGNALIRPLTKKNETVYLPKSVIQFMLDYGKTELKLYKIYHVAKMCRDIKYLMTNIYLTDKCTDCVTCKIDARNKFNDVFRQMWNFNFEEIIIMACFVNNKKLTDLLNNNLCFSCQLSKNKQCNCLNNLCVDIKKLKLAVMFELCNVSVGIKELMWLMMYDKPEYKTCLDAAMQNNTFVVENIEYVYTNRTIIAHGLYEKINSNDDLHNVFIELQENNFMSFIKQMCELHITNGHDVNDETNSTCKQQFYTIYTEIVQILNTHNVWWTKLIILRPEDNLLSWLVRFYMCVIMSKFDLKHYSNVFIKKIVTGYLYFRNLTNFNFINTQLIIMFAASLGMAIDSEKCCLYWIGESGTGKSSFHELLENIVVVFKQNYDIYTLSKNHTDESEADKLISQLFVINEMKKCDDAFFKNTADSSKSNSVCRKYQGSQKYEANYKLLITNNKPLYIVDYDKAVRNRFAIVYSNHLFEDACKFEGSVYHHIKTKRYPLERSYHEFLVTPVRLFLSHVLKYKRDPKNGYIYYKHLIAHDAIHNHNMHCMNINNSAIHALIYVLNVKIDYTVGYTDETKVDNMIELAAPVVETMLHDLMKSKRNRINNRVEELKLQFRQKFDKYYKDDQKMFFNLNMAWCQEDFVVKKPMMKC